MTGKKCQPSAVWASNCQRVVGLSISFTSRACEAKASGKTVQMCKSSTEAMLCVIVMSLREGRAIAKGSVRRWYTLRKKRIMCLLSFCHLSLVGLLVVFCCLLNLFSDPVSCPHFLPEFHGALIKSWLFLRCFFHPNIG